MSSATSASASGSATTNPQPATLLRKTIRYGCSSCPGLHYQHKVLKAGGRTSNASLESHVQRVHKTDDQTPDWRSLQYTWGWRLYWSDGLVEDRPAQQSAGLRVGHMRPAAVSQSDATGNGNGNSNGSRMWPRRVKKLAKRGGSRAQGEKKSTGDPSAQPGHHYQPESQLQLEHPEQPVASDDAIDGVDSDEEFLRTLIEYLG